MILEIVSNLRQFEFRKNPMSYLSSKYLYDKGWNIKFLTWTRGDKKYEDAAIITGNRSRFFLMSEKSVFQKNYVYYFIATLLSDLVH